LALFILSYGRKSKIRFRSASIPRTTWMKTTQQDLESLNLSLNEAVDVAQNRPLWSLIVVHARNE